MAIEIHTGSPDLTVLRAEEMFRINSDGGKLIDVATCEKINSQYADCTVRFEELTGLPAKETIHVAYGSADAFVCRALKITTASRKDALAVADGIGFYSTGWGVGRFIPTNKLVKTGIGIFKNGDQAIIHEFSGVYYCWLGSSSSSMYAAYTFRPYMRFTIGDTVQFNWDQVEQNYLLKSSILRFDRTAEVLQ